MIGTFLQKTWLRDLINLPVWQRHARKQDLRVPDITFVFCYPLHLRFFEFVRWICPSKGHAVSLGRIS